MKLLLSILFLLVANLSFPQHWTQAKNLADPCILSQNIIAGCKTEKDKVRAIYNWITDNISYQVSNRYNRQSGYKRTIAEEPEDTCRILKPLDERVAEIVLKRREAVCDGYARLFKTLCAYAGIRSELVTGYARTGMSRSGTKFRSNHTWNAVCIDSSWHLLDVTWATGYVTYSGEQFIRDQNDHYFLTPPQQFISDHYPEDLQWTLLPDPPTLNEFYHSPFTSQGFGRRRIISYKPEKGIIEASVGDTIAIELETDDVRETPVSSDPYFDSTLLYQPAAWAFIKPSVIVTGRKLFYTYPVESANVEWLHIIYNDEIVMRYRLNIINKSDTDKTAMNTSLLQ